MFRIVRRGGGGVGGGGGGDKTPIAHSKHC